MSKIKNKFTACLIAACMTGMSVPMTYIPYAIAAEAESKTITENLTLQEDMNVGGDLVMDCASLNLNGFKLTIKGDLVQKRGKLAVGKGTLDIKGNYILADSKSNPGSGYLEMNYTEGTVNVGGDFFLWSNSVSNLSNGIFSVGGNFESNQSDGKGGFDSWNNHIVCFTGDKTHTINFNSEPVKNQFNYVKMTGKGKLLLTGKSTGFNAGSDLAFADGSSLSAGRTLNLRGFNATAEGDFVLNSTMDINESKFTVSGNLAQPSGQMAVGKGSLDVKGDYVLADSRSNPGSGNLRMDYTEGSANVDGDFFLWSNAVSNLSNGVFSVGGNFESHKVEDAGGFDSWNNHVVCFTGDQTHKIYFNSEPVKNQLNNVELKGSGKLFLEGKTTGFNLASDIIFAGGSKFESGRTLNTRGFTVSVDGDLTQRCTISLADSTFNVEGNLIQQSGQMNVGKGSLNVKKDYILADSRSNPGSGDLRMDYTEGSVNVDGDYFQWSNAVSNLSNGKLSVGGNFESHKVDDSGGFDSWNNHVVSFKGDNIHNIKFNSGPTKNQLNNVELKGNGQLLTDGKTTGFNAVSDIVFADGSKLESGKDLNTRGFNIYTAGDLTQKCNINLDGSKFNVGGNLIQQSGQMNIGKGSLNIKKDYILADSRSNPGSGTLRMDYTEANVIVGGDFFRWSSGKSGLANGIVAVYGNFESHNVEDGGGYNSWNNHITAFLGGGAHNINFNAIKDNQLNTVQMTTGDSVSFTGKLNGVENGKEIQVSPDTIASADGFTLTAGAEGKGTVKYIGDETISDNLIIGAPDIPDVFDGIVTTPAETTTTAPETTTTTTTTTSTTTTTKKTTTTTTSTTTSVTTTKETTTTTPETTTSTETTTTATTTTEPVETEGSKIIFAGHTYQYFDKGMTWDEAKAECEKLGGHLVTITSEKEEKAVENLIKDGNMNVYWLGGKSTNLELTWITGESTEYTNWGNNQPDNALNGDCVDIQRINISGLAANTWGDTDNAGEYFGLNYTGFICEWDDVSQGLVTRDAYVRIQAEDYDMVSGNAHPASTDNPDAADSDDGVIGYIAANDYSVYNNVDFGNDAAKSITVRYSNPSTADCRVSVYLDTMEGLPLITLILPVTGSWNNYQLIDANIYETTGRHDVYLVYDTAGMNIDYFAFSHEEGKIPAEEPPKYKSLTGDVNGDGSINLKDVVLLRRYIAGGWGVTLDENVADVNGDNTVNLKDVVMLRRYIAGGWNVTLKK